MNLGKLYLIPSPLGENDPAEVIPGPVLKSLEGFRTFVVEEIRTARRYLSKAGLKGKIGELEFFELNEHTDQSTIESYIKLFADGNDVALISEAGLPAVADPGAQLVALAHRQGIEVVPAVGCSQRRPQRYPGDVLGNPVGVDQSGPALQELAPGGPVLRLG